jgi:hypothetical protein
VLAFDDCFQVQDSRSTLSFELGARLRAIRDRAFARSGLVSIAIPASVESLDGRCFGVCKKLSIVRFEPGSTLSHVSDEAFWFDRSFEVWIPANLKPITNGALVYCGDTKVAIIPDRIAKQPSARKPMKPARVRESDGK